MHRLNDVLRTLLTVALLFFCVNCLAQSPRAKSKNSKTERMVFVQRGAFQKTVEETLRTVSVGSFWIAKYDVTVAEFRTFLQTTGYKTTASQQPDRYPPSLWDNPSFVQTDDNPVCVVSWYDALAYCNWFSVAQGLHPVYIVQGDDDFMHWAPAILNSRMLQVSCDWNATGYRLPTEAEWQFAAIGGNDSENFLYPGSNDVDSVAWYDRNSEDRTHPVGQKYPNELGLYDMMGNVCQWCWDTDNPFSMNWGARIVAGASYGSRANTCSIAPLWQNGGLDPYDSQPACGFRIVAKD